MSFWLKWIFIKLQVEDLSEFSIIFNNFGFCLILFNLQIITNKQTNKQTNQEEWCGLKGLYQINIIKILTAETFSEHTLKRKLSPKAFIPKNVYLFVDPTTWINKNTFWGNFAEVQRFHCCRELHYCREFYSRQYCPHSRNWILENLKLNLIVQIFVQFRFFG